MLDRFLNRTQAGKLLAEKLLNYADRSDVIVLGLPRGGVPVAFEVAKTLKTPMDIIVVRKLGIPNNEELAMGAIALGNVMVLDQETIKFFHISDYEIDEVIAKEQKELTRRNQLFRATKPFPNLNNRIVILVDDGIATGSTISAAIKVLKSQKAAYIIVATPVAPLSVVKMLEKEVDEVICVMIPESFSAVGLWYEDFSQLTDKDVSYFLEQQSKFALG